MSGRAAEIKIRSDGGEVAVADVAKITKGIEGLAERAQKAARGDLINGIVDGIGKVGDALGVSNPALKEFLSTAEEIGKSMARDGVVGAGFNAWGIAIAHVTKELQAERSELEAMQKIRADTLAFLAGEAASATAKTAAMREQTALRQQAGRTGLSTEALLAVAEQERASKAKVDADELLRLQDIQLRNTTDHDQLQRTAASFRQAQAAAILAAEREQLAIATTADAIEKQREADKKKRDDEAKARRKESAEQARKIAEDAATHANQILLAAEKAQADHRDRLRAMRIRDDKAAEARELADAKATRDRQASLAREDDERQAAARQAKEEQIARMEQELRAEATAAKEAAAAKDAENEEAVADAGAGAARASLDVVKNLITGQQEFTKVALEEKAKQAGIEALFNLAVGTASLVATAGIPNPASIAAFTAAAQFAAIAGASVAASAAAPSAPSASASAPPARSSGGGSGGGGGGGTTVIINGRALVTDRDVARSVAQATRAAARYR